MIKKTPTVSPGKTLFALSDLWPGFWLFWKSLNFWLSSILGEEKSRKKVKERKGRGKEESSTEKNLQLARVNRLSSTLVRASFSEWVYICGLPWIWSTLLKGNFWWSPHTALQCTLQSRLGRSHNGFLSNNNQLAEERSRSAPNLFNLLVSTQAQDQSRANMIWDSSNVHKAVH